jgi:hypothetical protein
MTDGIAWPDDDALVALVDDSPSEARAARITAAALRLNVNRTTFYSRLRNRGLLDRLRNDAPPPAPAAERDDFKARCTRWSSVRSASAWRSWPTSGTVPPAGCGRRWQSLRANGYRVPEEAGQITLAPVEPDKLNLHRLDPRLLDGVHLLHGKGGMNYAESYEAQKLVDGYPGERKPAILHPGHWHVSGWIEQRAVNIVWPACFAWRSPFMARLGLSPALGFWIIRGTLGDDGSLVRFRPEWHRFYERRHVTPAAA